MLQHKNYVGSQASALVKMMISMVIFGSIGFFTQLSGLPSIELVFVRCICATLFLAIVWVVTGQHKQEQWQYKEVLQTLLCGFFLVFNWVFLFKAFEHTSVTVAISIYHLAPVFVMVLGGIVYREKLTMKSIFAVIACFTGTVLISNVDFSQPIKELLPIGVVWALFAALFYAALAMIGKGIKNLSPYATTFLQTGLGVFMLLPLVDFSVFQSVTATNWIYILATGIIHTGIVYLLYFDSLRFLKTSVISILAFLDPAVAIILDTLIVGFRPNELQTIGILLIFMGMSLTFIKFRKSAV